MTPANRGPVNVAADTDNDMKTPLRASRCFGTMSYTVKMDIE